MRFLTFLLWGCVLTAAEPAAPAPASAAAKSATAAAKGHDEVLDGGSFIGLIPISSPAIQKILTQYFQGFFRDSAANFPNGIPPTAEKAIAMIGRLKDSGATHVFALYHEDGDENEFVRLVAIGDLPEQTLAKLEADGIGRRGQQGSFDLIAFKDAKELPLNAALPALPIARISQMASQLAKDNDCSIDLIALKRNDAPDAYHEALMEAFAEEGQAPGNATVPRRAGQIAAAFPKLIALGADQVLVIAFQNAKGSDVVLVLAKGTFTPEKQAQAKAELGARNATETTITLARFVDGEERGAGEGGEKKSEKRPKK